jgi:hypothetical protein
MAFYNNRTAAEKKAHIYRPSMTLFRRGRDYCLKIQFSAENLLFHNNLQEAVEDQFEDVLYALQKSIFEMGVSINKEILRHAQVSNFHPSKNVLINGGCSATDIVREIAKVCVSEKMDIDLKDFRNGGHGVQLWAETHALTFYDKVKDLAKNDSRSCDFEKEQKMQRNSLLPFLHQKRKPEVVRMEARLCDKVKMKSVLKKIGIEIEPTFTNMFKEEICRKILLYYFETYIEPSFFVFDIETGAQEILKSILRKNPKMKYDTAAKLAALKLFCKDKDGSRGLRNIVEARGGERKWQRVAKDIKILNRKISLKSCHDYIGEIKQAVQKFKPYKPEIS